MSFLVAVPCEPTLTWPQAAVGIVGLLVVGVVLYAFCRYVLGDW